MNSFFTPASNEFRSADLSATLAPEVRPTGLAWLATPGRILFAIPFGIYGLEHFLDRREVAALLPAWMPWHDFFTLLVGAALIAAAVSISTGRMARLAAILLAVLLGTFELVLHIPHIYLSHAARLIVVLALRDVALGGAALLIAASLSNDPTAHGATKLAAWGRWLFAAPLVVFGLESLLYPAYWPGLPEAAQVLPAWIPAHNAQSLLAGIILVVAGTAIAFRLAADKAAAVLGTMFLLYAVVIFIPFAIFSPAQRFMVFNTVVMYVCYGGACLYAAATRGGDAAARGQETASLG